MKIKFKKYWRKTSLKKKEEATFLLNHVNNYKPKNVLEIGVFHGVTSRNICELLYSIHENDFKFTGIDLFLNTNQISAGEFIPNTVFSNPLKNIYYRYIVKRDPYTHQSVKLLLEKFSNNVNIIKGDSTKVLKEIPLSKFDYVFLDGGHSYETVKKDLINLTEIIKNSGVVLCDDYNLSYAPGVKKAIDEYAYSNNFNLRILNSRFAEITKDIS